MARKPDVDSGQLRRLVDALFGPAVPVAISRTPDGVSTQVYRLQRGNEAFYLRLAEAEGESLEPEALVHERLRRRGVKVPAIFALMPFHAPLARSVMVTTAIPGRPLGQETDRATAHRIIAAAGHDLAAINVLTVDGFGWIRRDPAARDRLAAEQATWAAFVGDSWRTRLCTVAPLLGEDDCRRLDDVVQARLAEGGPVQGQLAHGDFDRSHIYHDDGDYTGIIDFGEIRGAERWYDLGHFALHDGERLPYPLFPDLLAGYRERCSAVSAHTSEIRFWSLVIGVHALARSIGRNAPDYQRFMIQAIRTKLDAPLPWSPR